MSSSCEAECDVVVNGASRALGMQLGIDVGVSVEMATESCGAKSFSSRRGSGRIRHIEVKWLWLQHVGAAGRFRMTQVAGAKNPADILTKYKGLRDTDQLMRVNVQVVPRDRDQGGGSRGDKDDASAVGGRAARKTRVFSWAVALDEEQQA